MVRCLLAILSLFLAGTAWAQAVPTIAAASSLRYAMDEAAIAYARQTGRNVRFVYAASGSLVQQIEAGAPFQLFLSADEAHVFRLAAAGRTVDQGTAFALGRLVFITPPAAPITADSQLEGLRRALNAGGIRKLAIANPETAPYGARAQEALTSAGLWPQAKPLLVRGDTVGQAFQFVASGGADAGFASLSLALSPAFKGRYAILPSQWHKPLIQRMVLLKGAGPQAQAFHDWLLTARGQAVLARHGYLPPPRA